jgi:hypothetical protein
MRRLAGIIAALAVLALATADASRTAPTKLEKKAAKALAKKGAWLWPGYSVPERRRGRGCREFHYTHPHKQPKWEHAFFCGIDLFKATGDPENPWCAHFLSSSMYTLHNRRGYRYTDPMTTRPLDWAKLRAQKPSCDLLPEDYPPS